MTARERNLLVVAGAVLMLALGYNFFFSGNVSTQSAPAAKPLINYNDAARLLSSARNITEQNRIISNRLTLLEKRFLSKEDPDLAGIYLLREAEVLASSSKLAVDQKYMVRFSDELIGVSLEGKTDSESLICFMQRTMDSRFGLQISRLQLHSLPEQRLISYQIVISSLLR